MLAAMDLQLGRSYALWVPNTAIPAGKRPQVPPNVLNIRLSPTYFKACYPGHHMCLSILRLAEGRPGHNLGASYPQLSALRPALARVPLLKINAIAVLFNSYMLSSIKHPLN